MPFMLHGPSSSVTLGDDGESIFAELPRRHDLDAPVCACLWENFFRDPKLPGVAQVLAFRREASLIRAAHADAWRHELVRERKIRGPAEVVERVGTALLEGDPVLRLCDAIVALCDEAIAAGVGVTCTSD